jgi:hypothetical protein
MAIEVESSPFALLGLILAGVCLEVAQILPSRATYRHTLNLPRRITLDLFVIGGLVILVDIEFVMVSRGMSTYYVHSRPEA